MWIVIRLIVLLGGFCIRYLNVFRCRFIYDQSVGKIFYAVRESKHKGQLVSYRLAIPVETDFVFDISKESRWNRLLKEAGFASEIQTGDVDFDGKYYIGSDHYHFNQALRADPNLRQIIHDIIVSCEQIKFIECDGRALFIESKAVIPQTVRVVELLHNLVEKIKPVSQTSKFSAYQDPFIAKLIVYESVIISLSVYAFESFFEHIFKDQYSLDSPWGIFLPGTILGLVIIGVLIGVFYKYFRESARGHRVLLVNFIFLLTGSPFWGTRTFADLNQSLDKSPVTIQTLQIHQKEVRVHRSRKGGRSYTYHWHYMDENAKYGSRSMKVTQDVFRSANEGEKVDIQMREGAFGYPYRVSINNIEL